MNSKEEQIKDKNIKETTKKCKNPFKYFIFDFIKITGLIPMLLWLRPKFIYENKNAKKRIKGRAVVIANHTSLMDPVLMHCSVGIRRLYCVAMSELFERSKLANWFFRKILCVPIDRQNVHIGAFKDIINILKEDKVVGIFPEGHIYKEDATGVDFFKSGVVLMALKGKAPIIPMAFIQRKKWWQRQVVVIGESIRLEKDNMNLTDIANFSILLREKEANLFKIYEEIKKK